MPERRVSPCDQNADRVIQLGIDNFILHELLHGEQALTTEQHDDARSFPNVLRAIDYHADANAALAALLWYYDTEPQDSSDKKQLYNRWKSIYATCFLGVLVQMYVFDWPDRTGSKLPSRLYRTFIWHYHYHRALLFNNLADFRAFQILFEPSVNLRGVTTGVAVARDFGLRAKDTDAGFDLWLTAPNGYEFARVFRHSAATKKRLAGLLHGVWDMNPNDSRDFFDELFVANPELLCYPPDGGYGRRGDDNQDPDPNSPSIGGGSGEGAFPLVEDANTFAKNFLLHTATR